MAIWQILLLAAVAYGAIWAYFEASRLRDAYQIGVGPAGLPPQAWAALIGLFAPIALPFFFAARDRASLQEPREGAPPVFVEGAPGILGWLGVVLGLGGGAALYALGFGAWAAAGGVVAALAAFGGRRSRETGTAFAVETPSFEQVGFRPLKPQEDPEPDDGDFVLNLDRAVRPSELARSAPPPALPLPPAYQAPAYPPQPAAPAPSIFQPPPSRQPPAAPPPAPAAPPPPSLRPVSAVPIQIAPGAEILWAAAEEGEVDQADPRATLAVANPEVFRQLGGIFSPPPGSPSAARAASAVPPAPAAPPPAPAVDLPAAFPLPPLRSFEPAPARGPEARVPDAPARGSVAGKKGTGALPGGFAARSSAAGRPSPASWIWLLAGALLLIAVLGALVATGVLPLFPASETPPAVAEAPSADANPAIAETPAEPPADGAAADGEPDPDAEARAMEGWMASYLDLMGPVGLAMERVDYDGFGANCDDLERAILSAQGGMTPAPDPAVAASFESCMELVLRSAEECRTEKPTLWSRALVATKSCTHALQSGMSERFGFGGLLELELESESGLERSKDSMSGRYLAARSRG